MLLLTFQINLRYIEFTLLQILNIKTAYEFMLSKKKFKSNLTCKYILCTCSIKEFTTNHRTKNPQTNYFFYEVGFSI